MPALAYFRDIIDIFWEKHLFRMQLFERASDSCCLSCQLVFGKLPFFCLFLSEGSFSDTEKLMLIEQCPGPSSCCDHASSFLRLELQRAGYSPHSGRKFGQ